MDFVVRYPHSAELENRIESAAEEKTEFSEIKDQFYRPEGVELSDFSPRKVIVRKRKFPDRETLVRIDIIQKSLGYTDNKREVENLEGYEKWGEFTSTAMEYRMEIEGEKVAVLAEELSFGKYVKLEAPSLKALKNLIEEFGFEENHAIEKNSAELLADEMNLI